MMCQWVALVQDKETNLKTVKYFRHQAFGSERDAKKFMHDALGGLFNVIEVSTNPYKYKGIHV